MLPLVYSIKTSTLTGIYGLCAVLLESRKNLVGPDGNLIDSGMWPINKGEQIHWNPVGRDSFRASGKFKRLGYV
jgi:hypothetical protein